MYLYIFIYTLWGSYWDSESEYESWDIMRIHGSNTNDMIYGCIHTYIYIICIYIYIYICIHTYMIPLGEYKGRGLTPEIVARAGCFPGGPTPPHALSEPFWMNRIQGRKCIIPKPSFFC